MPAEPPVQSPATLDEAYQLLAGGDGWQPIAGGTDVMVQITGEIGPPPARVLDIWGLDELRGIELRRRKPCPGRADDLHRDPPVRAVRESSCRR